MKPSEKYLSIIQQSEFEADAEQLKAVALLDDLSHRLLANRTNAQTSWFQRLIGNDRNRYVVKGIYFWGGVGRGKTFLMDIFYQSMSEHFKMRRHFHDFMNHIHLSLKQKVNLSDPLKLIAEELAQEIDLLCLDEFVITDIGDAMIMTGLLEPLFEAGVTLVTTSNSIPANLYKDGLQRARFLPAIDLIENNCEVVNLDGGTDYRLLGLQQTHLYTVPHSQAAVDAIQSYLNDHVAVVPTLSKSIVVNGRDIDFLVCAEDTIWFSFDTLCKTSRSQNDYLELARLFNTLILTDIEVMSNMQDDVARRFVLLIDVIYDHRVKLICSAEAQAENLYRGDRLSFEFERTSSRLIEMQSQQYLTEAHTQQ